MIVGVLVFAAQVLTLRRTKEVHHLVNRNFSEQKEEIAALKREVDSLKHAAWVRSDD